MRISWWPEGDQTRGRNLADHPEGRLLDVCDCRVLCRCWIGEDPDNGACDAIVAHHFDQGTIDGVDVTNRTIALVAHLPGTQLEPYRGATGINTTLADTIFSTVPGAPVFVGKAARYVSKEPALGINVDLKGRHALQSTFVFDA
jgi:hypothetical protein